MNYQRPTSDFPTHIRMIVAQHGYRHRYLIARMFQEAGYLERLYTDTSSYSIVGSFYRLLRRESRLKGRLPQNIPRMKVFSNDWALLARFLPLWIHRLLGMHSSVELQHRLLSQQMKCWGVGNANWLYTMFDESLPFIRYAKRQGLKIAVDVFSSPINHRIIKAEMQHMGFPMPPSVPWDIGRYESDLLEVFDLANLLLCPSKWVLEGIRQVAPHYLGKTRLVPYGMTLSLSNIANNPQLGRILFCGRSALGKGLPTLATAAQEARKELPFINIHVAGQTHPRYLHVPGWDEILFLGELSQQQMVEEYKRADLFVLPTLAEGLSGVVVEALAAGLPVITTPCAGVDIHDGIDGILVQPNNVRALTQAIVTVVSNRSLRASLSLGARNLAAQYTVELWKKRLIESLTEYEAMTIL